MPTKLIVCLLAACVVAGSGAYLYFDNGCSGGCPLSKLKSSMTGCPECESAVTTATCEGETGDCCSVSKVSAKAKATCCSDEASCTSNEPMTAGFGGLAVATK